MEVKIINGWPVKIWADTVEDYAMEQITNLTTLPFLYHHLAIMPDVHPGMGMPIGGVLACKNAGAGRVLGRKAAIRTLNLEEEKRRLERRGIIHAIRTQNDLQEAAGAYKDIETVIKNELDLVSIKTRLLPIAVIKGD